jgi:succinate dehydrogenase / fumarate reductase, flavoprotein subunit
MQKRTSLGMKKGCKKGLRKLAELKSVSWKHVDDKAKEYNTNFTNVMETDSIVRITEIDICTSAIDIGS